MVSVQIKYVNNRTVEKNENKIICETFGILKNLKLRNISSDFKTKI